MRAVCLLLLLGAAWSARISKDMASIVAKDAVQVPETPDRDFIDEDEDVLYHWAVVIAGSNGWWNYRHQADACHAYQVLRRGGLQPQRIVLMIYDDLVRYHDNPKPGSLFNRPGGPDVYRGIKPDYRGEDVNAANFLAVLRGDAAAVANVGSGKVVGSGPQDRVFVFYSDHGSPGVLGMPTGGFLYADQLLATIRAKREADGYKEMVMYIEACESGSMFEGLLPPDLGVYVATASNAEESSWGTYCPGMEPGPPEGFDTCLGDLFSVAWMEDSEWEDLRALTLQGQFEAVRARTSNNFTYNMGSHAMQYGQLSMTDQASGNYIGMENKGWAPDPISPATPSASSPAATLDPATRVWSLMRIIKWIAHLLGLRPDLQSSSEASAAAVAAPGSSAVAAAGAANGGSGSRGGGAGGSKRERPRAKHAAVRQRDADLEPLRHRVRKAKGDTERAEAQAALDREVSKRSTIDATAASLASALLLSRPAGPSLMAQLGWEQAAVLAPAPGLLSTAASAPNSLKPGAKYVEQLVGSSLLGRTAGSGKAVVDDWECLRGMVAAWEGACGQMDQYAMKHTRLLANLCNAGVQPAHVRDAVRGVCAGSKQAQ
mmetsp:Transcript_3647/g.9139  ORF Transcript_3647/g.9139 Transcript_3647/m.9139 type:complete len:602 (-) Transcript_3647:361-2166(-)|eukprot:CAMPEP_0202865172 /NCGR_PEP_ID=MMETSP1391-20130828/5313_1 /ASSEMBLY_ACC=CAM_ASM_000867 /TAXON_ID=1034604 /ORGANISM="Chlamydomonas leiostraca, Strain SAG 11-49" /LENGTH=601 /DNA_ID=CAMNT_0049544977 /DNA_START=116 /DNA_END=1921 /DNA_ORIENTATION=+